MNGQSSNKSSLLPSLLPSFEPHLVIMRIATTRIKSRLKQQSSHKIEMQQDLTVFKVDSLEVEFKLKQALQDTLRAFKRTSATGIKMTTNLDVLTTSTLLLKNMICIQVNGHVVPCFDAYLGT